MGSLSAAMNGVDGLDSSVAITIQDRVRLFIDHLPTLTPNEVQPDDSCAICLTGFSSILAEATEMKASNDIDADIEIELGLTRLVGCGHLFCRKDLLEWIRSFHGSCPTCRHIFLDIRPPCESDGESSDGDYFPNEDEDDEEEDDFFDGDAEEEFEVDEMDLDEIWEDSVLMEGDIFVEEEWADGDTTFSEADMSIGGEVAALIEDANDTLCDETPHDQK